MVRALAVRGRDSQARAQPNLQITAFEAADQPATGASGNPVGIVHPFISKDWNLASQFMQAGVETTLRWVQELGACRTEGQDADRSAWAGLTGVLQLAEDDDEAQSWQDLSNRVKTQPQPGLQPSDEQLEWLSTDQIQERLSLTDAPIGGLWSPQGGWIKPAELVQACLREAKALLGDQLTIHFNHPIRPKDLRQLQQDFDAVVVCTAHDELLPWAGLRINKIAGQVSWIRLSHSGGSNESAGLDTAQTPSGPSSWPKAVICRSGYLSPVIDGQVLVGATFDRDPSSSDPTGLQPTAQAHAENLQRVAEISALLTKALSPRWAEPGLKGRVAIRHASHDRMPHVGRVIDEQALQAGLPRSASQLRHLPRDQNLFVLGGLGSRGLSIAPLAAEILANDILANHSEPSSGNGSTGSINGAQQRLPRPLLDAVDPARFVLRAHRRAG